MKVQLPPIVYIPVVVGSSADAPSAQYRVTQDNRKVLFVYTALDRLVDCMGDFQPWAACSVQSLEELWEADKFDLTLVDVEIPPEHREQGPTR